MKQYNKFEQDLKGCGLKYTKHRQTVLEMLFESTAPLSAEQIFITLKEQNISINLSTVYRTLDALESKNLITKQNVVGSSLLYEYNQPHHKHYLVCMGCKKIEVIEGCPLGNYEKELAQKTDFEISGHRLNIYGYCPKCK